MKTLFVVLALCFAAAAWPAQGAFPRPSEVAYPATGAVYFASPDFGAAAILGVGYRTSLNFSYNSDRTTVSLKTNVLTAKIGQIDVTGAVEGLYSSAERLGGRAILGAAYKDKIYVYAAPGNFWDSGASVKVVGLLSAYGTYGGWDQTAGLQLTRGLHYVQVGYSRVHGFVLGAGAAFSFR